VRYLAGPSLRALVPLHAAAATFLLTGCASLPTGPSVLVLPGDGKTAEQFRAEDIRCRQVASGELQTPQGTVSAQGRYDMAYMQCMYAEGNQVPLPGRGWRSRGTDRPAPLPSDVRPLAPGEPSPPPPPPAR
jgi:hypothetical protein